MQHVSIQLVATPVFYLIPVLPMLSARLSIILQSVLVPQATWEIHKQNANCHLYQFLLVANLMMSVLWTKPVTTPIVLILAIVELTANVMLSITNRCVMLQQDILETLKLNVKNWNAKLILTVELTRSAIKTNVLIPVCWTTLVQSMPFVQLQTMRPDVPAHQDLLAIPTNFVKESNVLSIGIATLRKLVFKTNVWILVLLTMSARPLPSVGL